MVIYAAYKHKVEAFSTFDVSVVEVDNLCGLQYTLVMVYMQHTQSPYQTQEVFSLSFTSTLNIQCVSRCDRLINAIWTLCLMPLHNKIQGVRLKCVDEA